MRKHREGWGCIYSALNLFEDLEYIGKDKTGDPENHRWKGHAGAAKIDKPKYYFHRAIKVMGGPEFFKWSIIWRGPVEDLTAKEVYYIAKRHTFVGDPLCRGYNLTKGGEGILGHKHSKKSRKKISDANYRRFEDVEERIRMSEITIQRFTSLAERQKISNGNYRRFEDPKEHRKLSKSQLHRYEDITEHEKLSAAQRRRFESPLEREKNSEAQLRNYKENPVRSKNHSVTMLRIYKENPEIHKKLRQAAKCRWSSVAEHEKASKAQLLRFKNPSERKNASVASKRGWVDRYAREDVQ